MYKDPVPPGPQRKIWWSNGIFLIVVHAAAVAGIYYLPPWAIPRATLILAVLIWQLADFGITIGYHRLYSHRAFRAGFFTRVALALLGSTGFQGSIKWWCLRHRLHHRFTDDPVHDPYAATCGLFYSHMGWIFFKPTYDRMELVDREDLDSDPVVRFQHKYYVPLALFFGFVLPPLIGLAWGDPLGSFVWGGLISRIAIWHCTFLVNSLAHWDGLQPYSDENTSRSNLILALLTGGEGNHNFHHAFPHDFRSSSSIFDWDPTMWIIIVLHRLGCVVGLRRAREDDVQEAMKYMRLKGHHHHVAEEESEAWTGEIWDADKVQEYAKEKSSNCLIVVDDFVVDVTKYFGEHPGGAAVLRTYSIRTAPKDADNPEKWRDASWAFHGGLNNHSRAARRRMRELRIAKLQSSNSVISEKTEESDKVQEIES